MTKDGIENLIDFMVEDIMAMSDEEILAETDPAELERAKESFAKALDAAAMSVMMGGSKQKPRPTALRMTASGLETVELDDDGKVIEPVRCTCGCYAVFHRPGCPFAYGAT